MERKAIILYGAPGSGKGTQANLLAHKLDLIHFDTGKFLEALVHDPKKQKNPIIAREKKLFDSGVLNTPSFVLSHLKSQVKKIAGAGLGIIFSGSPRTLYEAKGLMPILEKLYKRRNIFVFELDVPDNIPSKRNSVRLICTICGYPLLTAFYPSKNPKHCPVCAGPFYRRTLDNSKTIKVRLGEYQKRTQVIFKFLIDRKYHVHKINGTPPPYIVFDHISKFIIKK